MNPHLLLCRGVAAASHGFTPGRLEPETPRRSKQAMIESRKLQHMFWKIYFWIIALLICSACLLEGIDSIFFGAGPIWGTCDLIITFISMSVLFLYAYKKKIFSDKLWKIFLPIVVLWDFIYGIIIEPIYLEEEYVLLEILFGYLLILIPIYVAIYLYAFRFLSEEVVPAQELEINSKDVQLPQVQYPGILRRYLATFIDGMFIISILILASYIFQQDNDMATVIRVGIILSMFFIYEPVFTSQYCTLGQKIMGIRVRKRFLHERISIPSAYLRIIVKLLLGLISFFTIPFSKGKRAIHDFAVDSIVIYSKPIIA